MTRCSTGRATQKYRGNGTDLSDILETPGDIIYADAAVSAENLVISGTTGDVLKVSASGIPEWGTSTSQWITSGDDISYSLGHVGIGTTSPDANLHVTGNAFVSTDLGLGGTLTMGNVLVEALHELSAITATGNVTPHVIEFTNPTTGLVTTGNVGIGTATPLQTLEVNGSVGINHNGVGGYTFHTSTGALRAGIHSTGGNHLLFKAGSDNERMRLLAGGQLGIGTSTPSKPLTVDGNVHIPSGSNANSGSFPQNSVTRSIYFGGISQSGSMYQSKTAIVSAPWTQYGGTQSWGRHGLHFCVDSVADNGNVELGQTKMCINYLGNVGIGSWSTPNPLPQTMASVHGGRVLEGRDASGFEFMAASSDTTNANGQFNGAFLIKNMDTDGSEPHYVGMAGRGNSTNGSMDLLFYSGRDNYENNTPQMVIDPSGNVGIGTSAPGYTLDVTGDINFTGNLTQNGSAYGGGGSGSSPWTYTAGTASGTQQLVFDDQAPSTTFTGTLSGNVNNTAIRDTTNGYIRLTQAGTTRMGSAYWQTTLTNNWEATFEIYILPINYGGADDMRFVFYATNPITTNASATGTNGHGGAYMRWEYYNTDFVELYDHTATRVSQQSVSLQMSGWMPVTVTFNNGVLTSTIRNSSGTTLNATTHDFGTTYAALYNTPTYVAITGQSGGVQAEDRVRNITINALNVQTGDTVTRVNANVGIGTSSPDEILHLSSNDTNGAFLKVVGDTSNRAGIKLDEDAGDANIILEYDGNGSGAGNYFSIYSDVGGWIGKGGGFNYIPLNGRVGIGTNSPQGPLHVSSGTAGDCRLILQADTDNNDEGDNPRIEFWQDGAIQESAIGMTSNRLNLWNSVSSGGGIAFHTGTVDGWTNAIERMTITSAGNVGINQTSPNYTLDVTGDINFTGEIRKGGVVQSFGGGGSGSSPWVTSGNDISYTTGKVGVGTSSPIETLDVYGGFLVRPERTTTSYENAWSRPTSGTFDSGSAITGPTINVIYSKNAIYTTAGGLKVSPPNTDTEYFYVTASYYNYGFNIYVNSPAMNSTTSPYLSGDVFSSTRFKADNTEDFTGFAIGQDYQAGNALNDYSQSLDIARAHSAHMYFKTASSDGSLTEKMRITNTGNVGIGTSTPNYTLDVAGDLTCSGTMRHRAFAFYARASGGQIVANNGILSDSNSTITTEFDYTPAGTASSNGFRSSGGASNNQGTYFAPLDGIYHVSCKVRLNDSSTAQQEIQWYIKRTNGNEDQWESFEMWISPADGGGRRSTMSSTIVKLAKDEGIFPRADNPTTSLSSATFGGHFLGTY